MRIDYQSSCKLKELSTGKKAENDKLVKRLKKKNHKEIDNVVHNLHYKAFDNFDCLDCANCCKSLGPRITNKDIERLSSHLKMKTTQFIDEYLQIDEDNDYVFKTSPCPFLANDNYCLVYASRPKACKEYPHTDRKRFYQILKLSQRNCSTCPVVYGIFEELKKIY